MKDLGNCDAQSIYNAHSDVQPENISISWVKLVSNQWGLVKKGFVKESRETREAEKVLIVDVSTSKAHSTAGTFEFCTLSCLIDDINVE